MLVAVAVAAGVVAVGPAEGPAWVFPGYLEDLYRRHGDHVPFPCPACSGPVGGMLGRCHRRRCPDHPTVGMVASVVAAVAVPASAVGAADLGQRRTRWGALVSCPCAGV